ncbi:MAG: DUF938 domain-containing protein [Pseudomonadota bacterium]
MKKHAPATLRNREAIAAVLARELPQAGTVLEVAAGSGEHAVYFAGKLPGLVWQPSDPDAEALASIAAYRAEFEGTNLSEPLALDASAPGSWPLAHADAIVCINMVHISPWEATLGLFEGAAQTLGGPDAPLILYGPYFEQEADPAPSNVDFDTSLRIRNPAWGIRDVEDMDAAAARNGLARTARDEMPANNLTLVYRPA